MIEKINTYSIRKEILINHVFIYFYTYLYLYILHIYLTSHTLHSKIVCFK